ncbi:zinc-ribbon domain-containing protein, partial [Acetobacter oeni]
MKLFVCQGCRQIVFFENTFCEKCSRRLGFCSESLNMLALDPGGDDPAAPASGPATG